MVKIRVNGEDKSVPAGASIDDLLAILSIERGKVAIERNREIVPKSSYGEAALAEGDQIEVVQFVGGG